MKDSEYCWSEAAVAATHAPEPTSAQAALLAHIGSCGPCSLALEVVVGDRVEIPHLDRGRSDAIRERLVQRASNDRVIETPRRNFGLPAESGWFVAAGFAMLLLTHHSFHRPLQYGWLAAACFAVLALAFGLQSFRLRKELDQLRRRFGDGPTGHRSEGSEEMSSR